jgi:hypothetical protein
MARAGGRRTDPYRAAVGGLPGERGRGDAAGGRLGGCGAARSRPPRHPAANLLPKPSFMGHDPPHDQQEGRPPPHPMTARTPARSPASAPSLPECAPWPTRSPGPPTGRHSPRSARPETPPPATRHAPAAPAPTGWSLGSGRTRRQPRAAALCPVAPPGGVPHRSPVGRTRHRAGMPGRPIARSPGRSGAGSHGRRGTHHRLTAHRNRTAVTPHGGPHGTSPDTGHPMTRHLARPAHPETRRLASRVPWRAVPDGSRPGCPTTARRGRRTPSPALTGSLRTRPLKASRRGPTGEGRGGSC